MGHEQRGQSRGLSLFASQPAAAYKIDLVYLGGTEAESGVVQESDAASKPGGALPIFRR